MEGHRSGPGRARPLAHGCHRSGPGRARPLAHGVLPVRGARVRELGLPLPPARMPLLRSGRPLKQWRYVGVYTPELMLCVGAARVAGVPQRWWAVALPDGRLYERTGGREVELRQRRVRVSSPGERVSIDLELGEVAPVEVVSPHGRSYIWTAKQALVPVRGRVEVAGEAWELAGEHGFVDDSAGYHARHTNWRWSAGVGRAEDGRRVAWNLVDGVHDALLQSERTVWIEGEPREVGAQAFAPDLTAVGGLRFRRWCSREHSANRVLVRSRYRQPFGEFAGELPGGPPLAAGFGVMEEHDAYW